MFLPFSGRSTIRLFSTTAPNVEVVDSTSCASAVTCTFSLTEPNSIAMSAETFCCVDKGTASSTYFRNPDFSATRRYVLGGNWPMRKNPASLVDVL